MDQSDHERLLKLNKDYIDAVQHSNVSRFEEILAPDFRCSNPDGTLLDRREFLEQTKQPVSITELKAEDVSIRMFGDCAIIHACTIYRDAAGIRKQGRYTDVWIKMDGSWLAVSAHVTRG